jgi:integrase
MAGFTVYERDSEFFWVQARIHGKRWRASTEVPLGEQHRQAATEKAGALWLAECRRRGAPAEIEGDVSVEAMIDSYAETDLAARAKKRNERFLDVELGALVKHVQGRFQAVRQITPEAWADAIDAMHGAGLTLRSIQRVTSSLRGLLEFCRKRGALKEAPELPYPSSEEVAVEAKERRAMTADERDRFLGVLARRDRKACRIYTVMFYTLLRKSTVEKLCGRWLTKDYLAIPASAHKSRKKHRGMYLHPKALAAIRAQRAANGDLDPDKPIFGEFCYRVNLGNGDKRHEGGLFWDAVREAKIEPKGLTPHHVARHTGATLLAEAGMPLIDLMAQGLWDSAQAASRYMHVSAERTKKTAQYL